MNPNIELYETYRKESIALCNELLETVKDDFIEAARALGCLANGKIVFDLKSDQDVFLDFIIHDFVNHESKQKTAIQAYASSSKYQKLSVIKKELLDASLKAIPSLYLVKDVDKENNVIKLFDVLNSFKEVEIIDISLSQTLKKKKNHIFMRILQLEKFGMTSGVSSIFNSSKIKVIEKKYSRMLKLFDEDNIGHKRVVSFFHLNHTYGLPVVFK